MSPFDQEAVHARYLAERDRRLVAGRADIRDLSTDEFFARYRDDPFTPVAERAPVTDDIDVAIVGGGLTGCATAYAFAAAGIRVALFEIFGFDSFLIEK